MHVLYIFIATINRSEVNNTVQQQNCIRIKTIKYKCNNMQNYISKKAVYNYKFMF